MYATVLAPTARALLPSDIGVLEIITAGPPGVSVVPAIEMPLESGPIACPTSVVIVGA